MKNRILYRCLETNRYLCTIIQNKMGINKLKVVLTEEGELPAIAELMTGADTGFPYDGAKEHYILDIEHRDKAIDIIETLLPAIPYPKKKKKRDCRQRVFCGLSAFFGVLTTIRCCYSLRKCV